MRALSILALLLSSSLVHADEPYSPIPPYRDLPPVAQAHRLRNTGIGLAVMGTLSLVAGALLTWQASRPTDSDSVFVELPVGFTLLTGGVGTLAAGIPLIAVGQVRANRAERATLQLSAAGAVVHF